MTIMNSLSRSLPNKIETQQLWLNTVCPYYTMFPIDYPLRVLSKAKPGQWVLDPFCGRGTTAYASRLLGLNVYGTDTNPVAVAIASAKLAKASIKDVTSLAEEFLNNSEPSGIPDGIFWDLCYNPDTLIDICKIRDGLRGKRSDTAKILRAIFLGVLHGPLRKGEPSYLSNQMPRTFASKPDYSVTYWEKNNLFPPKINVLSVIKKRAERVLENLPERVNGSIIQCDARKIPDTNIRFDYIVTSPPYYGMTTYRPDQWLRYWALGYPPDVPYTDKTQISRGNTLSFIDSLSKVWQRVAELSNQGAFLYIRFGAVPSQPSDPKYIIKESLKYSGSPWQISTIKESSQIKNRTRQASQMGLNGRKNDALTEIEIYARLNS